MHIHAGDAELLLRSASADDDQFIFGLIERFVDFDLPRWRRRNVVFEGIRRDLNRSIDEPPPGSFLFLAEDASTAARVGFLHLQLVTDFFTGHQNCQIADIAVVPERDGQGIGRALLSYAERFAKEHRCERMQLSVFPGNSRARAIYEQAGYGIDMLRMMKPL